MIAPAQYEVAFVRANARRDGMSAIAADIKSHGRSGARQRLAELLADPDEHMGAMKVRRLLRCLPGVGDEWTRRALAAANLSDQHVRSLTPRQRQHLAELVLLPLGGLPVARRAPIVAPALAVTPLRLAAARRALAPYVAAPALNAAAEAALNAAARVRAEA